MNTQVLFSDQIKSFKVEAFLAARKLQLRRISSLDKIASLPVTLRLTETSICVLFRYGVVVFFNATQADKNNFFEEFSEQFISKFDSPEIEHLEVVLRSDAKECFETDCVVLNDTSLPKLQLLAESLAKSVILAHNESELVHAFDQIEPLALDLSQKGRPSQNTRQLQKLIGNILLREHTLVARAEAS
ncbi:MAG: RMD1 family protein, partial [Bdellovibrionales bacterium]|nr:RMD1 family protein [Bdellovibrionales bacterium]